MKISFLLRVATSVAALLFCFNAAGCVSGGVPAPVPAARGEALASQDYRLRPLDLVRFEMYSEPDNRGEYRVTKEGTLTLNFIGQIDVQGRTLSELKDYIEKRYREDGYYKSPQVTLTVVEYAERRIYVSGYVASPGPVLIPIEEELTLGKAIDAARGVLPRASRTGVIVTRTKDGVPQNWEVNLKRIQEGLDPDFPLEEGDRIYVPDSAI